MRTSGCWPPQSEQVALSGLTTGNIGTGCGVQQGTMKTGVFLCCVAGLAFGQTTATFEVASVKPAAAPPLEPQFCVVPCEGGAIAKIVGTRVDIRYTSLHQLILSAYRLKPNQLSGPDWLLSQRFDIAARLPALAGRAAKDVLPEMLQTLLAERFKLAIHRENREQTVLALVVAKGGAKLKPAAPDADAPVPDTPGSRPLSSPQGEGRMLPDGGFALTDGAYGPIRGGRAGGGGLRIEFLKLTMPALADILTPHADRQVVDMTGLSGAYVLVSENRPRGGDAAGGMRGGRKGGPSEPGAAGEIPARPNDAFGEALFRAIAAAGLRLEARKAPVEVVIVDHAEKTPTAN